MKNYFRLNSFQLKLIAIILMTIDHIGLILFPQHILLRKIGRLAFPIFCFLSVEGFIYTKDLKKYLLRLLAFALISEIPFDFCFSGQWINIYHQNVFFTLFLGVGSLYLITYLNKNWAKVISVASILILAEFIYCDYSSLGVLTIIAMYMFRKRLGLLFLSLVLIHAIGFGGMQFFAIFSIVPLLLYNGEQGPKMKYIFYWYYPLHIIVIYLLSLFLK